VITLYRPGNGWLHRMPAGPKAAAVLVVVLAISVLPTSWWSAGAAAAVVVIGYLASQLGIRELGRQVTTVRWVIVITLVSQLFFLGTEAAIANTARVIATLLLAALLVSTTRVADLLDAFERGLKPFRRVGIDPARAALMLAVAINTIPVLARLAGTVREAQRARGGRSGPITLVVPFLVVALKHADELGEALTARGVR
jgi:biotin transport system permease protein